MSGKYYVITLNCSKAVPNDAIERALGAYEWLRFAPNTYYAYTYATEATGLYNLLKPLLDANDFILVAEISIPNRHGWGAKIAADWFNQVRN